MCVKLQASNPEDTERSKNMKKKVLITGDGIEQDGDEMLLEVKSAVDKAADDEAVDNRNSTALGGSEHTEAHTDDDTEGEEKTPEGYERLLEYLAGLRELVSGGGVVTLLCDDGDNYHHGDGHQYAAAAYRGAALRPSASAPEHHDARGYRGAAPEWMHKAGRARKAARQDPWPWFSTLSSCGSARAQGYRADGSRRRKQDCICPARKAGLCRFALCP